MTRIRTARRVVDSASGSAGLGGCRTSVPSKLPDTDSGPWRTRTIGRPIAATGPSNIMTEIGTGPPRIRWRPPPRPRPRATASCSPRPAITAPAAGDLEPTSTCPPRVLTSSGAAPPRRRRSPRWSGATAPRTETARWTPPETCRRSAVFPRNETWHPPGPRPFRPMLAGFRPLPGAAIVLSWDREGRRTRKLDFLREVLMQRPIMTCDEIWPSVRRRCISLIANRIHPDR